METQTLTVGITYRILLDGQPAPSGGIAFQGDPVYFDAQLVGGSWVVHPLAPVTGVTFGVTFDGRHGDATVDILSAPIVVTFEPV